ncbi:MAG: bifunctional response regulator/alkaline phosphatase family protein, partial [Fulvivirga sp.]|uniref:T9SS response regulator signal transducer PorX n=1 Tax=Fulvivirga sp. TaxID=1931237 RepID=UPI0032EF69F7
MQRYNILWADDEIDLLKPHILFLENKGYDITAVNSGSDAVENCEQNHYDVVFLDENMPGMSGLEALSHIKSLRPNLPVVMITKNEEESIMEDAIGAKIADYLIKPINPSQILLSVKKILDNKRLITEKTNMSYQQEFRNISLSFGDDLDYAEWADVYKKLIYWELEIDSTENKSMYEVLNMQKEEANSQFTKFISDNYESWLNDPDVEKPMLSHQILKNKVLPHVGQGSSVFFLVIDNLRYDQWKIIEPAVTEYFNVEEEDSYYSILPTTTAYARNAIFSGLLPSEMEKKHPELWVGEDDDEGKNNNEDKFIEKHLRRLNSTIKFSYHKIKRTSVGKQLVDNINNLL